jgi:hypothetical protein
LTARGQAFAARGRSLAARHRATAGRHPAPHGLPARGPRTAPGTDTETFTVPVVIESHGFSVKPTQIHSRGQRPPRSINYIDWGPRHRARAPRTIIDQVPRATLRSPWAKFLRVFDALKGRLRANNKSLFISAVRNHAFRVITSQFLWIFHTAKGENR